VSTVLWANLLDNGRVISDERDKYALYKHSKKLNKLTARLGVSGFLSTQDFTDLQFNLSRDELPQGIETTNELMAQNGNWLAAQDALNMLRQLIEHIDANKVKFGLFSDDREQVLRELEESLDMARRADSVNGMFNFSVVM
jgi:hypothetical protein